MPQAPPPDAHNPFGTYAVDPTPTGIRFQVLTQDPRCALYLTALIGKSVVLALMGYSGVFLFIATLLPLLTLDAVLYLLCLRRTRLTWIEVRPDGLTVTPDIRKPDQARFFDRRAIARRELDCDAGLSLRYGIFDVQATPPFADEREFEVFHAHFEKACAKIWFHQNL